MKRSAFLDPDAAWRAALLARLYAYAPGDPNEAQMRERLIGFVATHDDALRRTQQLGHVTASAWIVDATRTRALLTHHRKFDRWVQLGGHLDGGEGDPAAAALREAREESGLASLRFVSHAIYDVDIHPIPARRDEAAHDHYDVRFLLEADADEPVVVSDESHDVAWIALERLAAYGVDESVFRLARKTPPRPG